MLLGKLEFPPDGLFPRGWRSFLQLELLYPIPIDVVTVQEC